MRRTGPVIVYVARVDSKTTTFRFIQFDSEPVRQSKGVLMKKPCFYVKYWDTDGLIYGEFESEIAEGYISSAYSIDEYGSKNNIIGCCGKIGKTIFFDELEAREEISNLAQKKLISIEKKRNKIFDIVSKNNSAINKLLTVEK